METLVVPLSIITASFFGSWHCAGMCGAFATMAGAQKQLAFYHFGRLVSYSFLGLLAGYLGQGIFNDELKYLKYFSATLIGLVLIYSGTLFVRNNYESKNILHSKIFDKFLKPILQRAHKVLPNNGFNMGVLTGLLPCGWLYTFVVASISTKSASSGFLVLVLFWLGTIPALSAAATLVRAPLLRSQGPTRKISGIILIFAGLYSIWSHIFMGYFH